MSELLIAQGIQSTIEGLAEFSAADVVINDWRILDGETVNSPYVNIETAGAFRSRQDNTSEEQNWEIPAELFVAFTEWKTSMDNLRDYRQAILDIFNATGTARSAGGTTVTTTTVDIYEVRNQGNITHYYEKYTPVEMIPESTPIYLSHRILFLCKEY